MSAPEKPAVSEKPAAKALPRVALDLRRVGSKYQMVEVTYTGGQCKERVAFESESGPLAAAEFFSAALKRANAARHGTME